MRNDLRHTQELNFASWRFCLRQKSYTHVAVPIPKIFKHLTMRNASPLIVSLEKKKKKKRKYRTLRGVSSPEHNPMFFQTAPK